MIDQLVRSLIERRVSNWADDNDIPVEWENETFTPPATSYARFNLLPAQTRDLDLAGKIISRSGIAQITIAVPGGNGPASAAELIDSLTSTFPAQLNIKSEAADGVDLIVIVMTPLTVPQGFTDKGHWLIPAYFQYRSDYVNP